MASATIDKCKTKARIPESVSSFIKKTYELLEEQKFPEIVDWNEEGTAIIIKNPIEFGQKVLSTYFKHNNLTSFVRQLNMYDFHKRRTQKYDHVYYHDLFQRGKKHLLQEIKRKSQDNTLANIQKAIETLETAQGTQKQDANVSNYESQLLKKLNKDALSRISTLENKVKDLTIQNQALWNQVTHQSQKEDLLVSLLASFMKKKGITLDQLPNIMNNQFNLPHIDLNPESKLLEKPITHNMQEGMDYGWQKANMAVNAGEFLSLSEDLSSSTEISPEDNDKSCGTNEGLLSVNEALTDMRCKSMEQITCFKPFNQEWAIPINNYAMNEGAEDESFGKIFFGKSNMLGKRSFDIQKGEALGVQKFLKQNPFNNRSQSGNPFWGNGTNEELSDMKIRKNDSLTDLYLNTEGQNNNTFDLLSFS